MLYTVLQRFCEGFAGFCNGFGKVDKEFYVVLGVSLFILQSPFRSVQAAMLRFCG